MTWQEYQDAVSEFYTLSEGVGIVERNVRIPDIDTGSLRQIDVMVTISDRGHSLRMIIDAKFRAGPLDVKDIEEVHSLASAVGANKAVIVASNGWGEPAEKKAARLSLDLRLLTLEDAIDLVVPDKWTMCPNCHEDCIVLDQDGFLEVDGSVLWWLAGQCRHCRTGRVHCQECGAKFLIATDSTVDCNCGHHWFVDEFGVGIDTDEPAAS